MKNSNNSKNIQRRWLQVDKSSGESLVSICLRNLIEQTKTMKLRL